MAVKGPGGDGASLAGRRVIPGGQRAAPGRGEVAGRQAQVGHAPDDVALVGGDLAVGQRHLPHGLDHAHLGGVVEPLVEHRGELVQVGGVARHALGMRQQGLALVGAECALERLQRGGAPAAPMPASARITSTSSTALASSSVWRSAGAPWVGSAGEQTPACAA